MRLVFFLEIALLLPPVLAGVIEAREDLSATPFNAKEAATATGVLQTDILAGVAAITQQIYQATKQVSQWKKCNPSNMVIRKEWSTFATAEKQSYIKAVKCLSRLPSKTPKAKCPGCKNRFDDFLGTHINQTFAIHNTGNFLGWHRYFTWAYEQTLRNECGYKGYQPYYSWPRWAYNPMASPALDGSDTSMSGNGALGCTEQKSYGIPTNDAPLISIPHGSGGGCVTSGPFKDWSVNLGPVFSDLTCTPANPNSNFSDPTQAALIGLGYNPRCLKRDISAWTSSQWTNDKMVTKLLNSPDMKTFWYDMQGGDPAFANNFMGVHTAGHFTVGGDPGSDFFTSPGDPWFYFHHAQIDRTWWTWQNLKPEERTKAVYGTIVIADPTAQATQLTDKINLGYAYPGEITLGDAMSTMGGPFCYTYV